MQLIHKNIVGKDIELNQVNIEMSKNDKKRKIIIPKKITAELAEIIGIIIGDGHVGEYINKTGERKFTHYTLEIDGNIIDENYYNYHVNHIVKQ